MSYMFPFGDTGWWNFLFTVILSPESELINFIIINKVLPVY